MSRSRYAAVVVPLVFLAGCGSDDDDVASTSERAEPAAETTAGSSSDPIDPDAVAFTFSGEAGEAGCRYEGPDEVGTELTSTANNETGGAVFVTLARLAQGATVEDFEAYVRGLGDSYPVVVPPADHQPAAHDWLEGTWLQLHTVPGGESQTVQQSSMFEGDYVAFCFRQSETGPGSDLWPAGTFRVSG